MPPVTPTQNPVTVSAPQQPAQMPVQLFPNAVQSAQTTNSVISELEKDWKSPAFWLQLLVQVLAWYGYVASSNQSLKIGTLTVSLGSLVAYLTHLSVIKKR